MNGYWIGLMTGLLICLLVSYVRSDDRDRDDTDSLKDRSGMRLHTDYKTGLQYLSAPGGGLTPRIGMDGKQMRLEIKE